jgi:uncharacterized protein YndB with AHSA1/START domain
MMADLRVELQAEVDGQRKELFPLVATAEGLSRWLDDAAMEPTPGGAARLRLRDATAVGKVLALDPPQHISMTWDWEEEPLGTTTVVAFDLIDHGNRTHLTVRHVGFRSEAQQTLHDAVWRYWFRRLVLAARDARETTRADPQV